ncbi:hypothetical protein PU629_04880 [Pullulanibacillus sp. KACC 23026]|uniref:hypothetical protein n=1 Tax=Pullulanibacillus sp. KACC 23026 TaxID=3028315 RepID=UPI0023B1B24D|nr:hypothetical protein [Pullulanibacillus sp. KACC 23026]WEG13704.1 hypothetical protein PU629_04880 [Pullulanibacillus sp. KACC 23026]
MEPILLRKLDISDAGLRTKMLVGDLDSDGRMELLMVQANGGIDDRYVPHQVQCLTAYDLEGRLLWQRGTPDPEAGGPGSDYPAQIYDIDGDGNNEILCVMEKKFRIIEGATGAIKKEYDLPDPEAHDCIIIANLSGNNFPQDIILKNRYHKMWALDNAFNLLWTYEGNIGHYPWVYDFNQDGRDEVMAGYDFLTADGEKLWSCQKLEDHADCILVADVDGSGNRRLIIGGSVTVMYDSNGKECWRYEGSIESQHVAVGKFRGDLPGLQIAGLDRIIRGHGGNQNGKDGLFLLDANGKELCKEDRQTKGWLTIIETIRHWDSNDLDYILAYRRGDGVLPGLYDGFLNPIVTFPVDGYVGHADLLGRGEEQVIIYNHETAWIFSRKDGDLSKPSSKGVLPQSKRLYNSTLYPGCEY